MRADCPVLVLTQPFDVTADYVVAELVSRGVPVLRFDPGAFPEGVSVSAEIVNGDWCTVVHADRWTLHLDDVGCAYWRRPTAFSFPEGIDADARRWAGAEARMGIGGILSAFPRWLNHPVDIAAAEYKPVQLRAAAEAGLTVPRTLLTSNPDDAREFVANLPEGAVYKPLSAAAVSDSGQPGMIYTSRVGSGDIDGSVRLTANLFQEWVPKKYEVRLTVVDEMMFAARIDAESADAAVDWRVDYSSLRYSVTEVPDRIAPRVLTLLAALRLRFGALDFIVTPDGEWTLLEVNPNGQWAWVQDATGLPIASAIADALTKGDTRAGR